MQRIEKAKDCCLSLCILVFWGFFFYAAPSGTTAPFSHPQTALRDSRVRTASAVFIQLFVFKL